MTTSETVKMITQSLTRLEEKLDKNTETLFEVKASHNFFLEKSNEIKERINEVEERHSRCPARKDYENKKQNKKNIAYTIGITATITTIITGIVATIFELLK